MILFPAIDILDKKCVRLTQGDYQNKTEYNTDPCKAAEDFRAQGAEYLHVVDLNAAKSGSIENIETIKKIVEAVNLPVQVGGGIRSIEAAERYFDTGVKRVIIGTAAVTNEQFLREMCQKYPGKVCLSLDVKNDEIMIKGWTAGSSINLFDYLAKIEDISVAAVIVTDISKDGMMMGPSHDLYDRLLKKTKHPIIASGGVGSIDDIRRLKNKGLYGAIIGKALYENKITLKQLLKEA